MKVLRSPARPRRVRPPLADFLLAALGTDLTTASEAVLAAAAGVPAAEWSSLPSLASRHGVVPAVHAALGDTGSAVPAAVRAEVRAEALAQVAHQLRVARSLGALGELFGAASIDWLVLKGPVLAEDVYRVPGRRSYADLDVLVRPAQVRAVLELLETDGAILLTRNWRWVIAEGKSELQLRLPTGIDLDLHWNVIASPGKAGEVRFDTGDLVAAGRWVTIGGSGRRMAVATLGTTDQMLHLAVHAVRDGLRSLRLLVDIDQAWRHQQPALDPLLARARQTGSGLFLAVALQAAARAVGTPVPPGLIDRLGDGGGRSWLAAMRRLDAYALRASLLRDPWFSGIRGATRTDSRSSAAAALAHGRGKAAELVSSPAKVAELAGRFHGRSPTFAAELALQARDVDGGLRDRFLRSLERG